MITDEPENLLVDSAVYYMKIQFGHTHYLLWLRAAVSVPYAEHHPRFKVTDVSHTRARTGRVLLLLLLRTLPLGSFQKSPEFQCRSFHQTNEVKAMRNIIFLFIPQLCWIFDSDSQSDKNHYFHTLKYCPSERARLLFIYHFCNSPWCILDIPKVSFDGRSSTVSLD